MTKTVNVPSSEDSVGHKSPDFMYVEDTKNQQQRLAKLSKRYKQRKINKTFKEAEKQLDQELRSELANAGLVVESIKMYHASRTLAQGLRIVNFSQYYKGMTLLVIELKNQTPIFTYVLCSKEDTYSRLEGRVYVKRKAVSFLKDKALNKFLTYPTPQEYVKSITPEKIGNWIAKSFLIPKQDKKVVPINPLKYRDEEVLLAQAKAVLATRENLEIESMRLHSQHIRFYANKVFSQGLVCTPEWFKDLDQEGKELLSNGGYTAYGILAKLKDSDEKLVLVTFARCSKDEAYVNSYGRKQCLINFIKGNYNGYKYNQKVTSINSALVSLAEQAFGHAINVKIDVPENNIESATLAS